MSASTRAAVIIATSILLINCTGTQQNATPPAPVTTSTPSTTPPTPVSPARPTQSGQASYYADQYHGRPTASGALYDRDGLTAAHRNLDFGTRVRVTNVANSQSVVVEVNDRGPFVAGRIIDLSRAAFTQIGNTDLGVIEVTVEVLD